MAQPPSSRESSSSRRQSRARQATLWAQARIERLERWTTAWRRAIPALDLLWEFASRFRRRNGTVLVGHLAYRFFIWLAPLTLVVVGGLGLVAANNVDLIGYATEFGVSVAAADDAAAQAKSGRVQALVIGIPALAIATWSLIRGVHYAFAQAWGLEITPRKGVLPQIGFTIVSALLILLLYLAIGVVQRQGPVLAMLGAAGFVAVTAALLWAISWVMPRGTDNWLDLVPGPALGAIGSAGVHAFIALYLPARISGASAVYGAIGVAIAILFYLFLLAYLLVGTAFINTVWADRAAIIAGRPWVVDPEGVPRWLQPSARWLAGRHSPSVDRPADQETRDNNAEEQ